MMYLNSNGHMPHSKESVMKIQVTTRPYDGSLHFQVGELGDYKKFDANLTGKESFKGLKKNTSLYGSSTEYFLIPKTALKNAGAFRAKHKFSVTPLREIVKAWEADHKKGKA